MFFCTRYSVAPLCHRCQGLSALALAREPGDKFPRQLFWSGEALQYISSSGFLLPNGFEFSHVGAFEEWSLAQGVLNHFSITEWEVSL